MCDLFLLSRGVFSLLGQLFSQRGNLQVCITWEQEQLLSTRNSLSVSFIASLPLETEEVESSD